MGLQWSEGGIHQISLGFRPIVPRLFRLPRVPARRHAESLWVNDKMATGGGEPPQLQLSSRHPETLEFGLPRARLLPR